MISRRRLLGVLGAGMAGSRGSWAINAEGGEEFEFPFLGDLHFDRPDHHDYEWMKKEQQGDIRQVENYCKVTREWSGKLLQTAKEQVAAAQAPVPFVLQLGDLIEGLCGSPDLAQRQAREAIEWVKQAGLGAPLAMCKGNHDVTGPGALNVYDNTLVPWLNQQLGGVDSAVYTRERGGTLIVFYDAYSKASLAWFEKLMAERSPQRLIFVVHPPVVPYNARATWVVYAKQPGERQRLMDLLGKHRAIVLCGHLHKYSCLVRRTGTGKFVQLAISSVATDPEAKPKDERQGLEAYSPDLVTLEPKHAPETEKDRRAFLEAERPFIEHYQYADTWGRGRMRFSKGGVRAEIYRGISRESWKTLDLSALLAG